MEGNTENVSEETSQPDVRSTEEETSEVSQLSETRANSPSTQESPARVVEESQNGSQATETTGSEGVPPNTTSNEIVPAPAAGAPSMPDLLAGGDNAQRVMECLREIIQCPVCFTVPVGMRIFCCRNGHSCCRQCLIHFRNITRTLLRRPFCPVCRTSMVRRKVFRNFVAEQIVAEYTAIFNESGENP